MLGQITVRPLLYPLRPNEFVCMLEIITMQNQEMSIILLDLYANYFHNINFMVPSITLLFINMAVSLHIWKTWIHTTDLSGSIKGLVQTIPIPCKCPNHRKKSYLRNGNLSLTKIYILNPKTFSQHNYGNCMIS